MFPDKRVTFHTRTSSTSLQKKLGWREPRRDRRGRGAMMPMIFAAMAAALVAAQGARPRIAAVCASSALSSRRRCSCSKFTIPSTASACPGCRCGACRWLAAHARALAGREPAGEGAALLSTWRGEVPAEWLDYNGHMTEHRYLQCFGEATDAVLARIGVDAAYLATHRSFYTVETHLRHLDEGHRGDTLTVETQALGADDKRLHLFHRLVRKVDGAVLATGEHMLLHVDTHARRSVSADGKVRDAVLALAQAHAPLPRPQGAGRAVGAGRAG